MRVRRLSPALACLLLLGVVYLLVDEHPGGSGGAGAGVGRRTARRDAVPAGATADRQHGPVGLRPDGTPGWQPRPRPRGQDMAAALKDNGFNAELSNSIPLDRDVPDGRLPLCRTQSFDLDSLPGL
jgi:hypothetical protein